MAPAAPMTQPGQAPDLISATFKDMDVAQALELIATQGDVEIMINEDVQGKIRLMIVKDKTAEQTIRDIARAQRLQWRKTGPNSFVVAKELPPEDVPAQATIAPSPGLYPGDSTVMAQPQTLPADVLPELSRTGGGEMSTYRIYTKYMTPSQIAWILDPQSQREEPLLFRMSRENKELYSKKYLAKSAFSPEDIAAQSGNYVPPAQSSNPYSSGYGGGFNQFASPYTQGSAQFGGGGFGGNQGGGRGNRGGNQGGGRGNRGNQGGGRGNQFGNQDGGNGGGGVFELPEGVDSITAVDPQNALLVFSTQEGFSRLQDIVNFLDLPLRQVVIEAQFVAVNTNDTNSLGIDFSGSNGPFNYNSSGFQPSPPSSGGSFQLGFLRGNFQASLRALLQQNRAKVVTAPRILAINNLTATLSSNTSTPIVTTTTTTGIGGQVGQGNQIGFLTSGISLTVTPTINNDDTITVVLQPTVQQQTQIPGSAIPGVVEQTLQTVANVRDGDTVALGGLRTKNLGRTLQEVPLLGRIPIIGALFRRKETTNLDQDLIIFLTATIVRRAPVEEQAVPGT